MDEWTDAGRRRKIIKNALQKHHTVWNVFFLLFFSTKPHHTTIIRTTTWHDKTRHNNKNKMWNALFGFFSSSSYSSLPLPNLNSRVNERTTTLEWISNQNYRKLIHVYNKKTTDRFLIQPNYSPIPFHSMWILDTK